MLTLYIHTPYCIVKCGYCDFHSLPTERSAVPHARYASAVLAQAKKYCAEHGLHGREIGAIFFGGGTPSLMNVEFFAQVLAQLREEFVFAKNIEITSEMNPATAGKEWMGGVLQAGVNRLSIGIQSFQPELLKFLDRDHTAKDVHTVLRDAKEVGFQNYSCDLIFAIPGQTHAQLIEDLDYALSYQPKHISAYQLTFEPGTPLAKKYKVDAPLGFKPKIDEELALQFFDEVKTRFAHAGLQQYEISNYALPGFESQHNLNYWNYGEYLGLGSGAVSFINQKRWTTTRNVEHFLSGDFSEKDLDVISEKTAMSEFCFLGLRKNLGISKAEFEQRFGMSIESVFAGVLEKNQRDGLLEQNENNFFLSEKGRLLSNYVFGQFF